MSFLHMPWKVVATNASLTSWGIKYNFLTVQGTWSPKKSKLPINILELGAIRLSLQHCTSLLQGHTEKVQSDNATAVAYINQEGTRSQAVQEVNPDTLLGGNSHSSFFGCPHPWSGQLEGRLPKLLIPSPRRCGLGTQRSFKTFVKGGENQMCGQDQKPSSLYTEKSYIVMSLLELSRHGWQLSVSMDPVDCSTGDRYTTSFPASFHLPLMQPLFSHVRFLNCRLNNILCLFWIPLYSVNIIGSRLSSAYLDIILAHYLQYCYLCIQSCPWELFGTPVQCLYESA